MRQLIVFVVCFVLFVTARPAVKNNTAISALDLAALIEGNGYPFKSYEVVTQDGYILTVHRIPHGINNKNETNKPVVFLQHGLLCSSADWVIMGPEHGMAYLLADLGYDVWMGNTRGNTYSRKHQSMDPDYDSTFWDFSWHEMGVYDLPAMIDTVLHITKQDKISYVGHSQGTTSFFVMASSRPSYNNKIRVMVALAPVVFMNHIPNEALKIISSLDNTVIDYLMGEHEFLPSSSFKELIGEALCKDNAPLQIICEDIIFLLAGYDSKQINTTTISAILSETPAGASTNQILHYAQSITSGYFRQFDYGWWGNWEMYGNYYPPEYDLTQIRAPVALFYGDNDSFTSKQDIVILHDTIPNGVYMKQVPFDGFTHLDFLWAIDIKQLVYNNVFDILKKFN